MKARAIVLPGLALGAAALLIVPGSESYGFSKIGGMLSTGQRDFRVFNNFADAAANESTVMPAMFPGWDGAELAVWKGFAEWGSGPHGNGTGDPQQANIGDGNANFDTSWQGNANGVGQTNHNVVSAISNCGGGTLAFTETPISDGWRIRFCDNWTWNDGPGAIPGSHFDIQGVACHEFGHALGLGHSGNGSATMAPSVSSGNTGPRSINFDDTNGIICIYGAKASTKPLITATVANGGSITIYGQRFDATQNDIWFTNANISGTANDPRIRVIDVPSAAGGTEITLPIPADAAPGDVLVKIPSTANGDTLSNAFPTDLMGTFGEPPVCFPNTFLPAALVSDPMLLDIGGSASVGPKIDDPTEPFDVSLDCSVVPAPGVVSITLRLGTNVTPTATAYGDLWCSGPKLMRCPVNSHTQNVVTCGSTTLPNDPSLIGITYCVQGFCGAPGASRLSNGLEQKIGQ